MVTPTVLNTSNPQQLGFDCAIGNYLFRFATSPDRRLDVRTAPLEADRVNTAETAEEIVSQFGQVFARGTLTGGEGLDFAHRRSNTPADSSRYWDSRAINVSRPERGFPSSLTLLNSTEELDASALTGLITASHGALFAYVIDTSVRLTEDITITTPVFSTESPDNGEGAQTLSDITTYGSRLYVTDTTNGIHRRTAAVTWEHANDLLATRIWGIAQRLVASTGTNLYEVDVSATTAPTVPLATLPAGVNWVDVAAAGNAILAAASDGYIYSLAPDDNGDLQVVSQARFESEVPTAIHVSHGSIVFVATSQGSTGRLWRSVINDQGQLGGSSVQREWDSIPRFLTGDRENVYTAIHDATLNELHIWRHDLVTGGMFRWWISPLDDESMGMEVCDGTPAWTVEGEGVQRPTALYEPTGYLITPLIDFFTSEAKSWVEALATVTLLPVGTRVELFISTDPTSIRDPDHTSWQRVLNVNDLTITSSQIDTDSSRYAALKIILRTTDTSVTPETTSFGVRGYSALADTLAILPVNTGDVIERPGRQPVRVPGHGVTVYQLLNELRRTPQLLQLYPTGEVLRGTITEMSTPILTKARSGSSTFVTQVTFRGRRSSLITTELYSGLLGTLPLFAHNRPFGEIVVD